MTLSIPVSLVGSSFPCLWRSITSCLRRPPSPHSGIWRPSPSLEAALTRGPRSAVVHGRRRRPPARPHRPRQQPHAGRSCSLPCPRHILRQNGRWSRRPPVPPRFFPSRVNRPCLQPPPADLLLPPHPGRATHLARLAHHVLQHGFVPGHLLSHGPQVGP